MTKWLALSAALTLLLVAATVVFVLEARRYEREMRAAFKWDTAARTGGSDGHG